MVRKGIACVILLSMVLHCASRLDVLNYLYQQRHQIAYSIGFISEIPIAICNSDYDFGGGLVFEDGANQSESNAPTGMPLAQEINLFFSTTTLPASTIRSLLFDLLPTAYQKQLLNQYLVSIFHPPAVA